MAEWSPARTGAGHHRGPSSLGVETVAQQRTPAAGGRAESCLARKGWERKPLKDGRAAPLPGGTPLPSAQAQTHPKGAQRPCLHSALPRVTHRVTSGSLWSRGEAGACF